MRATSGLAVAHHPSPSVACCIPAQNPMHTPHSPCVVIFVSLGLIQAPLVGADTANPGLETPPLVDLSLQQLLDIPVESVTGVSKYQQSIRRAPAGVTVFTASDIKNYGWTTLADALRAAPGLHIRSDRFYDFVGTRGFTRPRDYNARTLILLDGHRIDDSIYQQGAIGTDFILDLDMVERIEIINGPGSSVYGSNAFYGAVNIIPKTGRDIGGTQAGVALGSEPSAKGRVTVGDRTTGGVDYVVSATQWWSRGEKSFSLPASWRAVDPVRLTGATADNLDDMRHQSVFARAGWRGISGEVAYSRREKEVLPFVYYTPTDREAHGIDERAYALVRATGEPTPDSSINAKLAVDLYNYEGLFSPAGAGFQPFAPYANSLSINSELRWRQIFDDVQSISLGFEFQENVRQDFGAELPAAGLTYLRVRESSRYASPFAQLDWEFTSSLRASVGARYDYYDTGEERLTPRVGFIWDPYSTTTLKLLYGEAFRVPNVAERSPGEPGIVLSPNIGPETNRSWEFIAEHRFDSVWKVESHVYYTVTDDLITAVPNPANPAELIRGNSGRYITQGFDIGPTAYFPSGVQLRASATLQATRDDATDQIVADAPRSLGKLHFSAPVIGRWLRASGEIFYVGDRKDVGGVDGIVRRTGDYVTANVTLRAAPIWHRWDLALSVYNVADDRWSDPKDTGQISSSPRSVVLRAQVEF